MGTRRKGSDRGKGADGNRESAVPKRHVEVDRKRQDEKLDLRSLLKRKTSTQSADVPVEDLRRQLSTKRPSLGQQVDEDSRRRAPAAACSPQEPVAPADDHDADRWQLDEGVGIDDERWAPSDGGDYDALDGYEEEDALQDDVVVAPDEAWEALDGDKRAPASPPRQPADLSPVRTSGAALDRSNQSGRAPKSGDELPADVGARSGSRDVRGNGAAAPRESRRSERSSKTRPRDVDDGGAPPKPRGDKSLPRDVEQWDANTPSRTSGRRELGDAAERDAAGRRAPRLRDGGSPRADARRAHTSVSPLSKPAHRSEASRAGPDGTYATQPLESPSRRRGERDERRPYDRVDGPRGSRGTEHRDPPRRGGERDGESRSAGGGGEARRGGRGEDLPPGFETDHRRARALEGEGGQARRRHADADGVGASVAEPRKRLRAASTDNAARPPDAPHREPTVRGDAVAAAVERDRPHDVAAPAKDGADRQKKDRTSKARSRDARGEADPDASAPDGSSPRPVRSGARSRSDPGEDLAQQAQAQPPPRRPLGSSRAHINETGDEAAAGSLLHVAETVLAAERGEDGLHLFHGSGRSKRPADTQTASGEQHKAARRRRDGSSGRDNPSAALLPPPPARELPAESPARANGVRRDTRSDAPLTAAAARTAAEHSDDVVGRRQRDRSADADAGNRGDEDAFDAAAEARTPPARGFEGPAPETVLSSGGLELGVRSHRPDSASGGAADDRRQRRADAPRRTLGVSPARDPSSPPQQLAPDRSPAADSDRRRALETVEEAQQRGRDVDSPPIPRPHAARRGGEDSESPTRPRSLRSPPPVLPELPHGFDGRSRLPGKRGTDGAPPPPAIPPPVNPKQPLASPVAPVAGGPRDAAARAQLSWQARVLTRACATLPASAAFGRAPTPFPPTAFESLVVDAAPGLERPPPRNEHLRAVLARAPLAALLARDDSASVAGTEQSKNKHWEALYACDAKIKERAKACFVVKGRFGDILAPAALASIFSADGEPQPAR